MILENRDYTAARDYKTYDTERLREEYLIKDIFVEDEIHIVYCYVDRIIAGGVYPVHKEVVLSSVPELRAAHFLDRREMGVINIAGDGYIKVDGKKYPLNHFDCLYLGRENEEIIFGSNDPKNPAKFWLCSSPAHRKTENRLISLPDAVHLHLGSKEECNERTINKYIIVPKVDSCQLSMGLTHLEPGSVWNTMPCHTHARRMEVYFYFDMEENQAIFHFMGPKEETRHIMIHNEEAVISPSWSIHAGCSTKNYTFIWGMCGENQDYDDMDNIDVKDLL
ncbi:MAG: 5-dehydro-4-deoxy-D-glucuronate isomerase [Bacillota bacterium]|nr:5-dehydro-4-deoxy-D-glucuronate isomerase [Bacillota bacterium]